MYKTPDEVMETAVKVVKAICLKEGVDNSYVPKQDIESTMPCPVCSKGIVTYTISSYNGHRSAKCSEDCFGYYIE